MHLPPGEHAQTDKAGCGKDPSGKGRGLESTDRWMSQGTERIQVSKGHSQLVQCTLQTCFDLAWCRPIEIRMWKGSRQGALTFSNTDEQVRMWKERVRGGKRAGREGWHDPVSERIRVSMSSPSISGLTSEP